MFGNRDKAKAHEFPVSQTSDSSDDVVVFQQRLREVGGGKFELSSHPQPIQTIPLQQYKKLWPIPEGQKLNGFAQLGLHVTLLHDPSGEAEDVEEDFDLPEGPVAETGTTSKEEIIHEAVEAVEAGRATTAAENFTDRAQARDAEQGLDADGESVDGSEEVNEAIAEQKEAGLEAAADSTAAAQKLNAEKGDPSVAKTAKAAKAPAKGK
jgi:hypothetical protein